MEQQFSTDGGDGEVWKEAEAIQIQMERYILGVEKQSPKAATRGNWGGGR